MKKKSLFVIIFIVIALIVLGIITNYIDGGRVATNNEPKCCIKIVSKDGSKVTYWGLGYKVIRYVAVSPSEPYKNNIGAKMGNWFMNYELPLNKSITIEIFDQNQKVEITKLKDIGKIESLLLYSRYDSELCDGINTHKITMDNEVYYLKESCKEIQKGNKQAKITQEDLDTLLNIINNNV